jgi:replication factor C subunit 2/4
MNNLSLVEKYRPSKIENILQQNTIVDALKKTIKNKNIPHLLFYGSSGVGKTSIALALVKSLFNKENYDDRILELNASDERGIQIVREKIKNFAKFSINDDDSAKFKVIILDEADSMTLETQLALRYIIEQYSKFTRFIIICNYINKIIEPIKSRCVLYRFKPIRKKGILTILKKISKNENIQISNTELLTIYNSTDGDLRYIINLLERFRFTNNKILCLPNIIDINIINNFFKESINNDKNNVLKVINNILNNGNSATEILINILDIILYSQLDEIQKCNILYEISFIDKNLNNGCSDFIQLVYLSQIIYNI